MKVVRSGGPQTLAKQPRVSWTHLWTIVTGSVTFQTQMQNRSFLAMQLPRWQYPPPVRDGHVADPLSTPLSAPYCALTVPLIVLLAVLLKVPLLLD